MWTNVSADHAVALITNYYSLAEC